MTNFIEELYFGNIDPQLKGLKRNDTCQQQLLLLEEKETLLTETLTGEELKLFLDYANAWSLVCGNSCLDNFITGFRLGAGFALDCFTNGEAPFYDRG